MFGNTELLYIRGDSRIVWNREEVQARTLEWVAISFSNE